jgi:hypothetical protein
MLVWDNFAIYDFPKAEIYIQIWEQEEILA